MVNLRVREPGAIRLAKKMNAADVNVEMRVQITSSGIKSIFIGVISAKGSRR
jgi:hypothetical protein